MKKESRQVGLEILYEDNHLIAVNKPNGILVQPDITRDRTLSDAVKAYIKAKYKKPGDVFLGTIHRLDRPVSGVVVFARTSKALERMNQAFRDRQVEKRYLALIKGAPNLTDTYVDWIKKSEKENRSYVVIKQNVSGIKRCELHYEVVMKIDDYHMLKINPTTGRSHQIRVQLSHHGFPILGDLKYGGKKPSDPRQICLHCQSLSFIHPTLKERILIEAPPPRWNEWRRFEG